MEYADERKGKNMNFFEKYVIKPETVLIAAELMTNNILFSRVIEGEYTFVVRKPPIDIVEESLHYYCSSLRGAFEGTRSILGNISMPPIMIYTPLDICWFPSSSPYRTDCIWFSLKHVINCEKLQPKKIKVNLHFGHSIEMDMKKERFETKLQRASQLRYICHQRSTKPPSHSFGQKKGFYMVKESTNGNVNLIMMKNKSYETDCL
jgi:competence protein ComK